MIFFNNLICNHSNNQFDETFSNLISGLFESQIPKKVKGLNLQYNSFGLKNFEVFMTLSKTDFT